VYPGRLFRRIVPFLLVFASVALLLQPRISTWREDRFGRIDRYLLPGGLFAVSVYDGYFGAGSGVMVLALLLLTVDQDLRRANALKNVLLGVSDIVAAVGFALFGPVRWTAALPLAVGLLAGSGGTGTPVPHGPTRGGGGGRHLLLWERVPRRRSEPDGLDAHWGQHHLQHGLVAPGGEPVHWATSTISAIRSRLLDRESVPSASAPAP
jgi:hypothetical protein